MHARAHALREVGREAGLLHLVRLARGERLCHLDELGLVVGRELARTVRVEDVRAVVGLGRRERLGAHRQDVVERREDGRVLLLEEEEEGVELRGGTAESAARSRTRE